MVFSNRLYQNDLEGLIDLNIDWNALKGKSILITGASGMIGTVLVDILMKRNNIYGDSILIGALSRNLIKLQNRFKQYEGSQYLILIEKDICREPFLENIKFDYIIHAASNTHPNEYSKDPVGTITTNVFGLNYLLEYAKSYKSCRVILLSSVEIYGENRGDITYFDETYCGYINCNTLRAGYPESKRLSEALLQAYITQYDVDGIIVRLSRVYGPTVEDDDSKAISQFIRKAVLGEDIVLKSEGNQLFSYVYIMDAVQAIIRCMIDGECGEAYNVADAASDITLKDIAEYLVSITGKNIVVDLPDQEEKKGYSPVTKAVMNSEKIKKLGWNACYSMKNGLERTITILKDEGY